MNKPTDAVKKLMGDTAVYGLGTMVPRFLNYLLVPLYTIYVFTQAQYGQVTLLYSYVAILLVILTLGMETAFFRYANLNKSPKRAFNTAMTSILICSAFFLLLIFSFADDIAVLIQYPDNKEYVQVVALIIAIDAITAIPFAYLRYKNKALKFSVIRILSVVITISLNLLFLVVIPGYYGDDYINFPVYRSTSLVGFVFIANLVGSFSTLIMLGKELLSFSFKIDSDLLKKMLRYGMPILIISLMFMITEVADKILLKYLLPSEINSDAQLGIYAACYKLAIIMMIFIQMFRYAAEPFFFAEAKKKNAKDTYSRVMSLFVGFTWSIFLMVTLYIDVFKHFIGEAFWPGLQIVPIILSAKLFLGVFYNLSVWYKLTNKTFYGALIATVGGILTILLNVLLIPKFGYLGSAWASFVSYFVIMLLSYYWGKYHYKIKYNIRIIFSYTAFAVVVYIMSIIIKSTMPGHYYYIVSVLFVAFIIFVYYMWYKNYSPEKIQG
ncbi:MAG: oligosaccharide flippase family protein [Bacteroidales bacterium]|jgi:O-antigen/teichoic acid export membrane protein|nr:oligosaccharide flippase family protein [Bacteroidales bacterium]MDG2081912.1 oligosaccharide flippase family protein [Bacteroidales bacterium]